MDLVQINPATDARTIVSSHTNSTLGPVPVNVADLTWDFATGTIFYYDFGASNPGFYRVDPATGIRMAVSLKNGSPGSGLAIIDPTYMVTDPYGNLFYIEDDATANNQPVAVAELPVTAAGSTTYGARKIISSNSVGSQTGGMYYGLSGLAVDNSQAVTLSGGLPTAESLIVTDEGQDLTTSALFRVPTNTGAKAKLISYDSTNANNGSAIFDLPVSAVADTTGRLYYDELHYTNYGILTYVGAGTHAAYFETGDENLSEQPPIFVAVPPPTPTLAAGTVSNNTTGNSATLNSNVTADGGVTNSGIIARGFVYATTSANAAPKLGGTGVTAISNFQATTLPVAQGGNEGAFASTVSSLTSGTSYTFSAYAQDVSGYTYTAPIAFTVATTPTVTTPTATSITGTSATLGGDVTSDGGTGSITARGVVYSTTAANTTPVIGGTGVTNVAAGTATTGVFTVGATGLTAGTPYAYRAYATNSVGTSYSATGNFTTVSPPTANNQSVSTAFNTAKAITLTGSDPQSQTFTYTVATAPTHGTLSGTAPNLTYTPTANYHGADSFQFTTTNTSGLTSSAATVSITVGVGTPTANAQSVTIPFNTATAVTLSATDPDSPAVTLTYTVLTTPSHGTLSGTAPNLTYTPTANYQGSDSFNFRVSNGTNTSNTATVTLTVAAGMPTANAQSVNVNLNLPRTITLTGTDPDSPALALIYTVATQPANGTLSGTAPNLTYTPNAGYSGSDSFTFTVSNGQKTSAAATVSITVIGEPTVSSFSPTSGPAGTVVTITGTNLQNTTGVAFFRNVAATNVTVVSSTQITAVVPTGAKTGILTVLSGSGSNSSSTKFTITTP